MVKLKAAIDIICDAINTRARGYYGIDIIVDDVRHLEEKLCSLFTVDGDVLTCEFMYDETLIFCWGPTRGCHSAWVNGH